MPAGISSETLPSLSDDGPCSVGSAGEASRNGSNCKNNRKRQKQDFSKYRPEP
jgi:hypothetical protein